MDPTSVPSIVSSSPPEERRFEPFLLSDGYQPRVIDVLCGRGKRHWGHQGNTWFRFVVQANVDRYNEAPSKVEKSTVVDSVVQYIRGHGSHFLDQDDETGRWCDIGDLVARGKVGHALRDCIRKMRQEGVVYEPVVPAIPTCTSPPQIIEPVHVVSKATQQPRTPSPPETPLVTTRLADLYEQFESTQSKALPVDERVQPNITKMNGQTKPEDTHHNYGTIQPNNYNNFAQIQSDTHHNYGQIMPGIHQNNFGSIPPDIHHNYEAMLSNLRHYYQSMQGALPTHRHHEFVQTIFHRNHEPPVQSDVKQHEIVTETGSIRSHGISSHDEVVTEVSSVQSHIKHNEVPMESVSVQSDLYHDEVPMETDSVQSDLHPNRVPIETKNPHTDESSEIVGENEDGASDQHHLEEESIDDTGNLSNVQVNEGEAEAPSFESPVDIKVTAFSNYYERCRTALDIRMVCILCLYGYCVGCILIGIVLSYSLLHNHDECDMTWSQRHFFEIPIGGKAVASDGYKLYKFTDVRDPRHSRYYSAPILPTDTEWCMKTNDTSSLTVPVLFVPGHAGDYLQARSLGAHAIQLTGHTMDRVIVQSAIRQLLDTTTLKLDVYAVDLQEEWTALHGYYAERQTKFVERAIRHLVSTCGFDSVMIVGHSMGGLIAIAAAHDIPQHVHSIVTLGTPHQKLLTFEPTMKQWLNEKTRVKKDDLVLISISGGLRDEMIPPESCETKFTTNICHSFIAPEIMETYGSEKISPRLGMDHKALVWCRNLMAPVRRIVLSLAETQIAGLTPPERLHAVRNLFPINTTSFSESIQHHYTSIRSEYGSWPALAMKTTLLFNFEWLVLFYVVIGAIHSQILSSGVGTCSEPSHLILVPVGFAILIAIIQACHQDNVLLRPTFHTLLVASVAANAIFVVLRTGLDRLLVARGTQWNWLYVSGAVIHTAFFFSFLLEPVLQRNRPNAFIISVSTIILTLSLALIRVASMPKPLEERTQAWTNRQVNFISWILPVLVVVVAADLAVLVRFTTSFGVIFKICIPVCLRILVADGIDHHEWYSHWKREGLLLQSIRVLWLEFFLMGYLDDMAATAALHPIGFFAIILVGLDSLQLTIFRISRWFAKTREHESERDKQHWE